MSEEVTINGQTLMHFQDVLALCLDPILLGIRPDHKLHVPEPVPVWIDETKIAKHKFLKRSLTKKNESFLGNFYYLGKIICVVSIESKSSSINNYRAIIGQLISMHQDILSKLIKLHKKECNQIALNLNHSSLKYLNLPSKKIMIARQNLKQNTSCKVCCRGTRLISDRLFIKYFQNLLLKTINDLMYVKSLLLISQQWILNKKKIIVESINLANIDNDSGYENTTCDESYHNYDALLHDMDIIGQLKSVSCPFHVSKNFSPLKMIIDARNFYGTSKLINNSVSMIRYIIYCISAYIVCGPFLRIFIAVISEFVCVLCFGVFFVVAD